ncbi:L-glyceraldehyde 3-phosphate reductase [Alginatibacterium sediminis]|uniref:L-glyceraldehyde 3-phosphate reductase n=1 Tax=Alginatibacterium sediminis TaxID=2164068 RepID=A0A420EKS3_9ALTE|nr:L-glyceraldehyde 3-phosphate reductase [Alginatibacterium sediminis]RKF21322.1 L-glyceraldehyde 3-phosphate reductase [Alginatibacterium sediminis]
MQINDKSPAGHYLPKQQRYQNMQFRRCGNSGVQLPALSLGLWHNFGSIDSFQNAKQIARAAFDLGITHFDLANNYGPEYGSAETTFGQILKQDLKPFRDELFISSKAGYDMWPGPYGYGGSRKYLMASLDQSLQRMGLEYVDLFYHHCPDPNTPLEETMGALDTIVRSGKALYVGISNYPPKLAHKAINILRDLGTPCLIHQARYSMLDRWVEDGLLEELESQHVGCIAFSPLAQGMLTDRYLNDIPADSRAAKDKSYLGTQQVLQHQQKIRALDNIASDRGQKLSQMALAWLLRDTRVSSVLIGASSVSQLQDNMGAIDNLIFSDSELAHIERILAEQE